MIQIKKETKDLKCDRGKYNKIEIKFWKKIFLEKKPIPSPWINKKNQVIAFHNSFFIAKELGLKYTYVVIKK